MYMNNLVFLDTMGSQSSGDRNENEEMEVEQSFIKGGQHYTFADDEWDGNSHPSFES